MSTSNVTEFSCTDECKKWSRPLQLYCYNGSSKFCTIQMPFWWKRYDLHSPV